jgi:hypothetical protein
MAISKTKKGNSPQGLLDYLLKDRKDAKILATAGVIDSPTDTIQWLVRSFDDVASTNPKVKKTIAHIVLSLAPEDDMTDRELAEFTQDFLLEAGYDNNAYVIVKHLGNPEISTNRPTNHLHVAVSTIRLDGSWVDDSWNWRKAEAILRELEKKYDLKPTLCSWESQTKSTNQATIHRSKEGLPPTAKEAIQAAIDQHSQDRPSLLEFCHRLQADGITPTTIVSRTGKIQGIKYSQGDFHFAGSQLDNASHVALLGKRGLTHDPQDAAKFAPFTGKPSCQPSPADLEFAIDCAAVLPSDGKLKVAIEGDSLTVARTRKNPAHPEKWILVAKYQEDWQVQHWDYNGNDRQLLRRRMAAIDPETIAPARAKLQAMLKEGGDRPMEPRLTMEDRPKNSRRSSKPKQLDLG